MNAVDSESLNAAAARTLIAERCHRAYLHEIRGGLQALSGAFELLARLAKSGDGEASMVERAAAIARRAILNHENSMLDMVRQITTAGDQAEAVDVVALVEDILRFMRNDFAARQITPHLERCSALEVNAPKNDLRLILLGLIARRIDDSPEGSRLSVRLSQAGNDAVFELSGAVARPQVHSRPREIILDMARHWLGAHRGRLEFTAGEEPSILRLYYPARR